MFIMPNTSTQTQWGISMVAKRTAAPGNDQPTLFDPTVEADTPATPSPNIPANFPASWTAAIGAEFDKPYFAELRQFIVDERKAFEILPPAPDVFNAFRATPLDRVRVVLLGQDPYPTQGHAHGLCFSVRPGVRLPGSLRNIYRELEADLGIPPATHGFLESWAKQGVLMLNAVLTVRAGVPNSHKGKGWETFTDAAIAAVNALPRRVVFVLWGSHAQKKAAKVRRGQTHDHQRGPPLADVGGKWILRKQTVRQSERGVGRVRGRADRLAPPRIGRVISGPRACSSS